MTGFVEVREHNGLDYLHIAGSNGSYAEVFLFGATLTKFVTSSGKDVLFTSSAAVFDGKTAIRGGVPVIFPQFGTWGNLPKHGVARTSTWSCVSRQFSSVSSSATLELCETEETMSLFPFHFRLEYTITVCDESLESKVIVHNTDSGKDLNYDLAFHTYFRIPSLEGARIEGLSGSHWKSAQSSEEGDVSGDFALRPSVDIVFEDCNKNLSLVDSEKRIVVQSPLPKRLAWNCGPEGARAIEDMGDEDWKVYFCLETCAFHCGSGSRLETIHPGEHREYSQLITVESL